MANATSNIVPFGTPTALNSFTSNLKPQTGLVNSSLGSSLAINPNTGNTTTPAAYAAGNQPALPPSYGANTSTAGLLMGPLGSSTTPQMPQAPSQPVKSHSVTDVAGNTVTQKYDTSTPAPTDKAVAQ